MVDLMTVPWRRSGHTGEDSKAFWFAQALEDRLAFANGWGGDPRGHFDKFKSAPTLQVFEILQEIGEFRSDIVAGGVFPPVASHPTIEAIVDDTFDVVKYYPGHCGGWHGLLRIRIPNPSQRVVVVDRPTHNAQRFVRWPPSGGRGFAQIHRWLTQSITIDASAFDVGNSWTPSQNMLLFLAGMKAVGGPTQASGQPHSGFEAFASTLRAMVYENFDKRIVNFYLRHLRGHGPTEAGTVHHFNQLVMGSGEADATGLKGILDTTLAQLLLAFPPAWGLTSDVSLWSADVVAHLEHWRVGCGNHREGLTWLKQIIEARKGEWNGAGILDVIGGVRETQRTIGLTVSRTLTTTDTVTREVSTAIEEANRVGTTQAWSNALSTSITRLQSLTNSTSSGSSNTTGTTIGNQTSVMVGGETGALEELLLGKINGELTNTTSGSLTTQFESHRNMENSSTSSTSNTSGQTTTMTLQQMRERTLTQTRAFRNSVSRAVSVANSLSANSSSVINMDANRNAQKTQVGSGLDTALRAVNDALSHL